MEHTPGPWTLETVDTSSGTCHMIGPFPSKGVYDETHACVYADNVRQHDYGHSKIGDELLANARLIRAAPAMEAALRNIERLSTDHHAVDMAKRALAEIESVSTDQHAVGIAKAALAKVEE